MNNFSNTVEQNMENNCTERIPEISLVETFGTSQEQKKVEVVSISHPVGVIMVSSDMLCGVLH